MARGAEARRLRILQLVLGIVLFGPLGIWRAFSLAPEIAAGAIKLQAADVASRCESAIAGTCLL